MSALHCIWLAGPSWHPTRVQDHDALPRQVHHSLPPANHSPHPAADLYDIIDWMDPSQRPHWDDGPAIPSNATERSRRAGERLFDEVRAVDWAAGACTRGGWSQRERF